MTAATAPAGVEVTGAPTPAAGRIRRRRFLTVAVDGLLGTPSTDGCFVSVRGSGGGTAGGGGGGPGFLDAGGPLQATGDSYTLSVGRTVVLDGVGPFETFMD